MLNLANYIALDDLEKCHVVLNDAEEKNMHIDLFQTTKQVFSECASEYLKEDKHWGSDLDFIRDAIGRFTNPSIIDLGTGSAFHLLSLFFLTQTNLQRVVGVDYSKSMLEQAKQNLSSIYFDNRSLLEKIELYEGNILNLPFKDREFDIAIFLNNLLGNIPCSSIYKSESQRIRVLREMRRVLRPHGSLVISVYNSSKFSKEDGYGEVFEIDENLSNLETFDVVVRYKKTGTPGYSHWFGKDEICNLLSDQGFKIIELEERRKRIVISAIKN